MDDWTIASVDGFFASRESPTREECPECALAIVDESTIEPVETPGSLSYTVVCTAARTGTKTIVSFRQYDTFIDPELTDLAGQVHGHLVPHATFHGTLGTETESNDLLKIYTMPCLPGTSGIAVLRGVNPDDTPEDEVMYTRFIQELARAYLHPQTANAGREAIAKSDAARMISVLMDIIKDLPFLAPTLNDLEGNLDMLFGPSYPQLLTHGDLGLPNILMDETSGTVTGIVDRSLATIAPCGMELGALRACLGAYRLGKGWTDFACRDRLITAFWDESWRATDIQGMFERQRIRHVAELAGKLGILVQYLFKRNPNGTPKDGVAKRHAAMVDLWFQSGVF
ncbi:Uu.00g082860.m01.CDS01 [Anthostomella pinea]|uniref:Uu.00g082860.m01.CDS01 n=1 Tax=Anthostomella pinea TaxID=933095 RepID=A0AAI8VLF7_9PEZI|nr:Uu.00g082860.m01.CDS01 [Anthostomella pinea]